MNSNPTLSDSTVSDSPDASPLPYDHTSPLFNLFYGLNEDSNSSGDSHFYSQTPLPYSPLRNQLSSTPESPTDSTQLPSRTLFSHLPITTKNPPPDISSSSYSSVNRSFPPYTLPSASNQIDYIPSSDTNHQTSSSILTLPTPSSASSTSVPLLERTYLPPASLNPIDTTTSPDRKSVV